MRVSPVNYYVRQPKLNSLNNKKLQKTQEPTQGEITFRGPKEAVAYSIIGGIMGATATVLTGGLAGPLVPQMMIVGAALGMGDDSDDPDDPNDSDDFDD